MGKVLTSNNFVGVGSIIPKRDIAQPRRVRG